MIVRVIEKGGMFILQAKKSGSQKWGKHASVIKTWTHKPSYKEVSKLCRLQGHRLSNTKIWKSHEIM